MLESGSDTTPLCVSAARRSDRVAVRRNVTADSDPDLFFGLRGAGGALGVVLAFTTLSFPVPPVVSSTAVCPCTASDCASLMLSLCRRPLPLLSSFASKGARQLSISASPVSKHTLRAGGARQP